MSLEEEIKRMQMRSFRPEFYPSQEVKIRALNERAIVNSVRLDVRGFTFLVAYWMDGKRYEEWLYDHELESTSYTS